VALTNTDVLVCPCKRRRVTVIHAFKRDLIFELDECF